MYVVFHKRNWDNNSRWLLDEYDKHVFNGRGIHKDTETRYGKYNITQKIITNMDLILKVITQKTYQSMDLILKVITQKTYQNMDLILKVITKTDLILKVIT